MERFERVILFAHADKLDRLPRDLPDRKRRTAARIAIHLGEHHAGESQLLVKLIGRAHRVLPGHRVGHKQNLRRIEQLFQRLHLIHQLIVNMQTPGGIDDQHVAAGIDGLSPRFFHQTLDRCRIRLAYFALVNVRLDRISDHFQLLSRCRAIDVDRNQQWPVSALFQPVASLPEVVVLPEPCRPAISTTVGGCEANLSLAVSLPSTATISSRTILMTCSLGESAVALPARPPWPGSGQ